MPAIRVELLAGRTSEQKEKLALELTKTFVEHAGGKEESVHVIFVDVEAGDWAIGGRLLSETH